MGVVRKQSILSSIYIYIGFAIGAVNILILFPRFFTPEEIGLTRILLDVALLFATLCTLGSIPITLKFAPFYQRFLSPRKNDLPFLTMALASVGCLLLTFVLPLVKPLIIRKFGARSPLFVAYFDLVYPFAITLVFFSLLEAHAWSRKKTVLSNALKEFAFRLLTTLLILAFIAHWLNFSQFIRLYSWTFLLPVLIFLYSLSKGNQFSLKPQMSSVTRRLAPRMASFGAFVFGGAILNIIARTNDTIILASQSTGGLADAAVFTIATYLVTVMEVPQRSLVSISTPVIAEAWRDRNLPRIDRMYQKTALNLLISGLAIFGLVQLNMDNAVRFLGPAYQALGMIVLVSGVAKLFDLATGLNTQILLLSKYWKFEFLSNMLLVALSIPLNYWLTRKFNVMGPAYGNLIALTVFNLGRFFLIRKLFGLQPFRPAHLKALGIAVACFLLAYVLPYLGNLYLDVIVRSAIYLSAFSWLILKLRVSEDINGLLSILKSRFNW